TPRRGTARDRAPAGIEVRLKIAVITRVDGRYEVFAAVREKLKAGGARVEAEKAQRGDSLLACGNVDGEPLDRHPLLARAEVGEPDERKRKDRRGVAIRRARDSSPGVLAMPQQGARETRRQAVFQVGLGAENRDLPLGKLAVQEKTKALTKNQP